MLRMNFPHRRLARKAQAEARQESRSKRDNEAQLVRLDLLLGDGKGAVKERLKLQAKA